VQKNKKLSSRKQVAFLSGAFFLKRLLNLVTPVFLVRFLDVSEYGEYQLFWLIANTALLLAPMGMSRSLLYFIPRLSVAERAQFVSQTILYLCLAGLLAALLLSPWSPLLPESMLSDRSGGLVITGFVFLWIVSSLIEILPSADQNVGWQAKAIVGLAIFRNTLVITTAAVTDSLNSIYFVLLLFVCAKVAVLAVYCVGHYGWRFLRFDLSRVGEQLRYALPFGLSNTLTQMRGKAEQWIVAILFVPSTFGLFSIVLMVVSALSMLRKSIGQVITPKMSRSESKGDLKRVLALNNRGNLAASMLVFPAATYLFAFAEPVIELVYTQQYLGAAPILRIYLVIALLSVVEVATLLVIFKQGKFVLKVSGFLVVFSVAASYLGATLIGLKGVAIGSLLAMFISKLINFHRASRLLEIPLHKLQDWKALLVIMVTAALSATFAWYTTGILNSGLIWVDVVFAGVILAISYAGFLFAFGYGWLVLAMLGKHKWPDLV